MAETIFSLVSKNRAHLSIWFPWVEGTKTPADSSNFIIKMEKDWAAGEGGSFLIRDAGEAIGVAGFHFLNSSSQHSQIGYWLGSEAEGRGAATAATLLLVDYFFAHTERNCLEIRCLPHNIRSSRVALRCGFTHQQSTVGECGGQTVAHEVYMLTRTEYQNQKTAPSI